MVTILVLRQKNESHEFESSLGYMCPRLAWDICPHPLLSHSHIPQNCTRMEDEKNATENKKNNRKKRRELQRTDQRGGKIEEVGKGCRKQMVKER